MLWRITSLLLPRAASCGVQTHPTECRDPCPASLWRQQRNRRATLQFPDRCPGPHRGLCRARLLILWKPAGNRRSLCGRLSRSGCSPILGTIVPERERTRGGHFYLTHVPQGPR